MKRHIYVPEDAVESLERFFLLTRKQIQALEEIVCNRGYETPFDVYVAIMNGLDVSDKEAEDLFDTYQYLVFAATNKRLSVARISEEILHALKASKSRRVAQVQKNMKENEAAYEHLLSARSTESIIAKRQFLTSRVHNSLVQVKTVCDLRPIFDEDRKTIVDGVIATYFDLLVTDTSGSPRTVPIWMDEEGFQKLKKGVEAAEKKVLVLKSKMEKIRG